MVIAESPLNENILFVGTDDGLVQVSEDMGQTWREIENFPGVPKHTYISDILPSKYDENTVYISFDNRKHNDLKPYILKSTDMGLSWTNISGDLPENGSVHSIQQDHVNSMLMFAGTEFGVYFSANEGQQWIQLKSGIPTISVRDIAIQERENDLVLATFGRGFYILDNYAPLREIDPDFFNEKKNHLFEVKDALQYMEKSRGGYGFGSMPHRSPNREYGAIFTYYLDEVPKTTRQERREMEKDLFKNKDRIPIPEVRELMDEEKEVPPFLRFTITDEQGEVVRKLQRKPKKGINRESWNLRHASSYPKRGNKDKFDPFTVESDAMPVLPGKYSVDLELVTKDTVLAVGERKSFQVTKLNNVTLPANDNSELVAFQKEVDELARVIRGADRLTNELTDKLLHIKQSVHANPKASGELMMAIDAALEGLYEIKWRFRGEIPKASSEERIPAQVTINDRLGALQSVHSRSSSGVTGTQRMVYEILETELPPVLEKLDKIANKLVPEIEVMLDAIGAPWTPGRVPKWNKN